MNGERLTGGPDQGSLLAENLLGNIGVLRGLWAGGREKDEILNQVVSSLKHNSIGQKSFLVALIQNAAADGDNETVMNRRSSALAILTDKRDDGSTYLTKVLAPLVEANRSVVQDAYIKQIGKIGQRAINMSTFSGPVAALLDIGEAIASHVFQKDNKKRQEVIRRLENIIRQIPERIEQSHVRSRIELIKRRIPSTSIIAENPVEQPIEPVTEAQAVMTTPEVEASTADKEIKRPRSRPANDNVQLDSDVERLRNEGLSYAQIAKRLEKPIRTIAFSSGRLIAAEKVKRLKTGPKTNPDGFGDLALGLLKILQKFKTAHPIGSISLSEMGIQLGVSRERTRQLYEQLGTKYTLEKVERLKRGPKTNPDGFGDLALGLLKILQKFKTAHPIGSISLSEMGIQLGVSRERTRQLYEQLGTKYTLPPKSRGGMKQLSKEYVTRLDEEVAKRTNQEGMTQEEITEELCVPSVWVKASQRRLSLQNQEQEKKDQEEFRTQVEQLRNQGMGNNRIAGILRKSRSQVQHIAAELVRTNRVKKMRQRKSRQELAPFDAQVKILRAEGLTYQEMAQQLTQALGTSVSVRHIHSSVQRLQRKREITIDGTQFDRALPSPTGNTGEVG